MTGLTCSVFDEVVTWVACSAMLGGVLLTDENTIVNMASKSICTIWKSCKISIACGKKCESH